MFPSFPSYKEGSGGRGQIEPGPPVILQNSDALANVFALSPKPGGPPLGLGAPGFSRSEPIVVTPLPLTIKAQSVSIYSVNIVIPKIISIQLTPC